MSSEEVAQAGRKQLDDLATTLAGPAKALETATAAKAKAGAAAGPEVAGLVASFGPERLPSRPASRSRGTCRGPADFLA